jgi:hypothetical protein
LRRLSGAWCKLKKMHRGKFWLSTVTKKAICTRESGSPGRRMDEVRRYMLMARDMTEDGGKVPIMAMAGSLISMATYI